MQNYHLKEIISYEQIQTRVKELATCIQKDIGDEQLITVCILNGAYHFFSDLTSYLTGDNILIDFMRASSYGENTVSSLKLDIRKDIELDVKDKCVLLVDDIIDTGLTLEKIVELMYSKGAKKVLSCTLIDKKERRLSTYNVDYSGFKLEKGFLVGYGLDMGQKLRNLNGLYEVCFDED